MPRSCPTTTAPSCSAGAPAELVLYAYGRAAVARVELEGDADDIAALQQADLGIG